MFFLHVNCCGCRKRVPLEEEELYDCDYEAVGGQGHLVKVRETKTSATLTARDWERGQRVWNEMHRRGSIDTGSCGSEESALSAGTLVDRAQLDKGKGKEVAKDLA